jgi:hypothetical protein
MAEMIDWNLPDPSEVGGEAVKTEQDGDEEESYLEWDHKLDMSKFKTASILIGKKFTYTFEPLILNCLQILLRQAAETMRMRRMRSRRKMRR